eukprot:g3614.t1
MLKSFEEGAAIQEVFQTEIQALKKKIISDSKELEILKGQAEQLSKDKMLEEHRRLQKEKLLETKLTLVHQIASFEQRKLELETRREQLVFPKLANQQQSLKVSQQLVEFLTITEFKDDKEQLKNKLDAICKEQENLKKKLESVKNELEVVQSMDASLSDIFQNKIHQKSDADVIQQNWQQQIRDLKSEIAELQVELQSKKRNSIIQNSKMIGYCEKKSELKMIQENINHLKMVMDGTEQTISSNENTQFRVNKEVFDKINSLFQHHCSKLLPQMRIRLEAEDQNDPSKGILIRSGLENLGADQLSGGQRTLISLVLLISAARVGGYAQTLLMDEVQ